MLRLASILYCLIATALAGTAVIAVLSVGLVSVKVIVVAALLGASVAAPASWLVARKLYQDQVADG